MSPFFSVGGAAESPEHAGGRHQRQPGIHLLRARERAVGRLPDLVLAAAGILAIDDIAHLDVHVERAPPQREGPRHAEVELVEVVEALRVATDLGQFLASLQLQVEVAPAQAAHLSRVAELVQRTNQFNLTGVRRRAAEIQSLLQAGDLRCLIVHVRDRLGDILPTLEHGYAHVAAAGISLTQQRQAQASFAPSYLTVRKSVVYNTDQPRPRSLKDLAGKRIKVLAGSSTAEQLRIEARDVPGLRWDEAPTANIDLLLQELSAGKVDYVVSDSHAAELARRRSAGAVRPQERRRHARSAR